MHREKTCSEGICTDLSSLRNILRGPDSLAKQVVEFVGIVDEMELRRERGNCNLMLWRREITVMQRRGKLDRMEI